MKLGSGKKMDEKFNTTQQLDKFSTPRNFRGRSALIVQLWWIVQASLFACSPQLFYGWRRFLLRAFGAKVGKGVVIRPSAKITYPWKVEIGEYSWVGDDVTIYSLGDIKIGAHSVVSQKCYLCAGSHDYNDVTFPLTADSIHIGDHCWLATDVYVAPGIVISDGCVVGARSSVFKNLPAMSICVGTPAKKIKSR